MSNPFANGSAISAPMSTRPTAVPTPAQPQDAYWNQVYANERRAEADLDRDMERGRLIERGRALAGFVQVDRRGEGLGFQWMQRSAPAWPAQLPAHVLAAVERAIIADHTARSALDAAVMQFSLWQRDHASATPERARVKYDELTEDLVPAAQRAAQHLDAVLVDAAALVESIEEWSHILSTADARRAAVEKRYQQDLTRITMEEQTARAAAQRAGVTV